MIIIADAGSTKTRWALVAHSSTEPTIVTTCGINPVTMTAEAIGRVVLTELMPSLQGAEPVDEIYYYGAGVVSAEQQRLMAEIMKPFGATRCEIASDMVGAARALFGDDEGIACILGTGSNSCLYDGERIADKVPALGYVLGDEGSGAVIGRRFVGDLFKRLLPPTVEAAWNETVALDEAGVIDRVYRRPGANAFLGSLMPFIHSQLGANEVKALVEDEFDRFFTRNVDRYTTRCRRVGFVGSVAVHFATILRQVALTHGYECVKIINEPLGALICYHKVAKKIN